MGIGRRCLCRGVRLESTRREGVQIATKGTSKDTIISASYWRVSTLSASRLQVAAVMCNEQVVFECLVSFSPCRGGDKSDPGQEESPVGAMQPPRTTGLVQGWEIRNSNVFAGDGHRLRCAVLRCAVGPQPYVCRSHGCCTTATVLARRPAVLPPLPWPPK